MRWRKLNSHTHLLIMSEVSESDAKRQTAFKNDSWASQGSRDLSSPQQPARSVRSLPMTYCALNPAVQTRVCTPHHLLWMDCWPSKWFFSLDPVALSHTAGSVLHHTIHCTALKSIMVVNPSYQTYCRNCWTRYMKRSCHTSYDENNTKQSAI